MQKKYIYTTGKKVLFPFFNTFNHCNWIHGLTDFFVETFNWTEKIVVNCSGRIPWERNTFPSVESLFIQLTELGKNSIHTRALVILSTDPAAEDLPFPLIVWTSDACLSH